MIFTLITSNLLKAKELEEKLRRYGIQVKVAKRKKIEIQSDNLQDIVEAAAQQIKDECSTPILLEDSGLFIKELKGFPGPYSSYVYQTIGLDGILKIMKDISNRNAEFQSVIALKSQAQPCRFFHGKCEGMISKDARGFSGFGFDPIFIPKEGKGKTFAEMSLKEKNLYSHRSKAVESLVGWYTSQM